MKCLWCGERLQFKAGKGWLHPNGELYKTFVGDDGETRDDHCVFAIPDDAPTYEEYEEKDDEQVIAEEVLLGTSPALAGLVAMAVVSSPEYRAAWEAGWEERQREREEREEELLAELGYPGNPCIEEL